MTNAGGLQDYLAQFRRRLKLSITSRGIGALALVALLLTLVLVYFANLFAFSDSSVLGARSLLILGLIAAVAGLLVWPLRKLGREGVAPEVEKTVPAFDGRVETYVDQTRRAEASGRPPSPLLDLLAEDALKVAHTAPAEDVVTTGRIFSYSLLGVAAVVVLLWLGASGPGYWGYGTARLWGGWLDSHEVPLYDVEVEPGDATVRSGASFGVTANLIGFDTADVMISAQYQSGVEWEEAPMAPQLEGAGFEFTFTGVREPFQYYVEAGGVRSNTFEVDVVVMPNVTNVKLTYEYPKWTGLEAITEDPGGDIRAVAGTKVLVELTTDKPLRGRRPRCQ